MIHYIVVYLVSNCSQNLKFQYQTIQIVSLWKPLFSNQDNGTVKHHFKGLTARYEPPYNKQCPPPGGNNNINKHKQTCWQHHYCRCQGSSSVFTQSYRKNPSLYCVRCAWCLQYDRTVDPALSCMGQLQHYLCVNFDQHGFAIQDGQADFVLQVTVATAVNQALTAADEIPNIYWGDCQEWKIWFLISLSIVSRFLYHKKC